MLLNELISIPEQIHASDFVLKLNEALSKPEQVVEQYVCTDAIAGSLRIGVKLVIQSLGDGRSRSDYLHGSFGSGKSHWMAVLSLLLRRDPALQRNPRLAALANESSELAGRKILMVPYHMIEAKSLQQAILEGYVNRVHTLHPEAPLPAVFRSDALLDNAAKLRAQMGDESFLKVLNTGNHGEEGWGDLAANWTVERLERAWHASALSPESQELVSALTSNLLSSFKRSENNLVSLDDGLAVICQHAKSLGYDGLVLFLDELVLWLVSHSADAGFVRREGELLVKLVESQSSQLRPIPLVSIIARQRDLQNILGDDVAGAQRVNFDEILHHQSGRFGVINLLNADLAQIVQERLLKPKDAASKAKIDEAFSKCQKELKSLTDVLLGEEGNQEQFRDLYPFHPALVDALVNLSEALQRDRTTLRSLQQLLVERRSTLEVGQLIPVGDLWDVISDNDPPASSPLANQFKIARALYESELRPMLYESNGLPKEWNGRTELAAQPEVIRKVRGYECYLKTILLASLVPALKVFSPLNAERLLALNHGNIRSQLPNQELGLISRLLRDWASRNGKIRLLNNDSNNPTVSIHLADVDVDSLLDQVAHEDNDDTRRRTVQEALFNELGMARLIPDLAGWTHQLSWRGVKWPLEVRYQNVRTSTGSTLAPSIDDSGKWLLVIDYPFDDDGFSARDDHAALERLHSNGSGTRTLCWLPEFFNETEKKSLGKLIRIRYLLVNSTRFEQYAVALSPIQRNHAKSILENQKGPLEQALVNAVRRVYGIGETAVQTSHMEQHFRSLRTDFRPLQPARSDLAGAMEDLFSQMLEYDFPNHPKFAVEVDEKRLKSVAEVAEKALMSADRRSIVQDAQARALMRDIAMPLKLGLMHDQYFESQDEWFLPLEKRLRLQGSNNPTVGEVFAWLDGEGSTGLSVLVKKLVVWLFALKSGRGFYSGTMPYPVSSFQLLDQHLVLKEQALVETPVWDVCRLRAQALLGCPAAPLRNAQNQTALASEIRTRLAQASQGVHRDHRTVETFLQCLGLRMQETTRGRILSVAKNIVTLPENRMTEESLLNGFAEVFLDGFSELLLSPLLLPQGGKVATALEQFKLAQLQSLTDRADSFGIEAQVLMKDVKDGIIRGDHEVPVEDFMKRCDVRLQDLIRRVLETKSPAPPQPPLPIPPPQPADKSLSFRLSGDDLEPIRKRVRELYLENPGKKVIVRLEVVD